MVNWTNYCAAFNTAKTNRCAHLYPKIDEWEHDGVSHSHRCSALTNKTLSEQCFDFELFDSVAQLMSYMLRFGLQEQGAQAELATFLMGSAVALVLLGANLACLRVFRAMQKVDS